MTVITRSRFGIIAVSFILMLTSVLGLAVFSSMSGCANVQTQKASDTTFNAVYKALSYERTAVYTIVQTAKRLNTQGIITDSTLEKIRATYVKVQAVHNQAIDAIAAAYSVRSDWYNVSSVQDALVAANQSVTEIVNLAAQFGVK